MTPDRMRDVLTQHPFPGIDGLCQSSALSGGDVGFRLGGAFWRYTGTAWGVNGCPVPVAFPAFGNLDDGDRVHAEIRRVLTIVNTPAEPSPTLAEIKADCVGPDLPADDPLYDRAAAEQALAKVTAERDDALTKAADLERRLDGLKSDRHEETVRWADEREALRADLAKITDAHAVVSQRLAGSQKEVTERDATIGNLRSALEAIAGHVGADPWAVEEIKVKVAEVVVKAGAVPALEKCVARLTEERDRARFTGQRLAHAAQNACRVLTDAGVAPPIKSDPADKAEARVKRLRKSNNAAHAVLDEAGIGLAGEGSPRWTLARRCRTLAAEIWDHLDTVNAIDEIAKVVGLIPPSLSSGATDGEVVAKVKALHQDDDTRTAVAVAVGLDGSASLGMILDTVKRADTTKDADLLRLVSYHQAPIRFNDRPLTLAERAIFVIRRLWQGRTNAAAEAASLRRELGDIADALGDLPDTAEREPIGDREEHLGLSTAERIRLSR